MNCYEMLKQVQHDGCVIPNLFRNLSVIKVEEIDAETIRQLTDSMTDVSFRIIYG